MLVRAAAGSSLTPKWNWNLHLLLFLATWLGRSFLTDVCGVKSRDRDSSLDRCMGLFFLLWFTLPSQIYITLHLTGICENFDCYRLLQWAEHVQLLKTVNRDGRERWLSLCLSLSLITAKFVHILNLDTVICHCANPPSEQCPECRQVSLQYLISERSCLSPSPNVEKLKTGKNYLHFKSGKQTLEKENK